MSEPLNQKEVDSLIKRTSSGGRVTVDSLTQREIDAILQKTTPMPLAPVAQADIVAYNFSRPPRVSKDRRASLESIYQRFALGLQGLLASLLRTPLDVVVASVEQAMFSEFVLSLGTPCAAFVFDIGDRLGGQGAVDLSTDFAFHLVDRLFGGPGDAQSLQRPLTQLEQAVVRSVAERSLGLLREAWQDDLVLLPRIASFESNPDMLQITSREDNVLVTNLEIRSTSFNGFLTLCMPMASLETFLQEKATSHQPTRALEDTQSSREQAGVSLQFAQIGVRARFPTVWLTARQVAELSPGQVLHTGQGTDEPVEVHLNDRPRFLGTIGQVRRHLGLRLTERVQKPVAQRPSQVKQGRVS